MSIHTDFPLSQILWYKVGGVARYVLDVTSKNGLLEALQFIQKNNIQNVFVCGSGSNLIFSDSDFDGAVIRFVAGANNISLIREDVIEAFAGELLDDVIQFGFKYSLAGLEWAGGLPGTVGGAVRGNVGAFGGEIKDVLESAEVIKVLGNRFEVLEMRNNQLNFSYRDSIIKQVKTFIVVSAKFKLKKATPEELEQAKQTYQRNIEYRLEKHPMEYPNCGSVFKNIRKPEEIKKVLEVYPDIKHLVENKWYGKVSMGYLIALLGFKGFTIGEAQVSLKHQNYVVNLGNAKASDMVSIIETIKKKFIDTFGFAPEIEAEIVS